MKSINDDLPPRINLYKKQISVGSCHRDIPKHIDDNSLRKQLGGYFMCGKSQAAL